MADASAPDSVRPDAGAGFRFEMAIQNAVLGFWPHALALLVAVLLGFLIYGQYESWRINGQQATTAQIALQEVQLQQALADRVDPATRELLEGAHWNVYLALSRVQTMPPDQQMQLVGAPGFGRLLPLMYGGAAAGEEIQRKGPLGVTLRVLGDLDEGSKAIVLEAADRFVALGAAGTGPARAEAYAKAAELYRVAGETEKRRAALEQIAGEPVGAIAYGAVVSLAGMQADQGDVDGAIARLRAFETGEDRFIAQDASATIGALLEAAGRAPEARDQYTKFLETWSDTPMAVEVKARLTRLGGTPPAAPTDATAPGTPE